MQTIKVIGEVDQHHQLVATVPDFVAPGKVEVLVISHSGAEDDAGTNWMAGVARQWQEELADPREDIYSLSDGAPIDGPR